MQPILTINLTTKEIGEFVIPEKWVIDYLGGASLAARMLYDSMTSEFDPLSSRSPLLFLTGPLTGTAGPAVGRYVICARSPATGLWGESNSGGYWGPELRRSGYDGLLIVGRASEPSFVWINNGITEIHSAVHLWGQETYTTQATIKSELNDDKLRVAVIGPAGENKIPFALILNDHGRVAGRTGMGALMGSKNLKAIAVKGYGEVPINDHVAYQRLRSIENRRLRDDPVAVALRELGTANGADYFDYLGEMPKRYFNASQYPEAINISGASISETILSGVSACHACVIACGRVVSLGDGKKRKGPEYETLVGFGPNLWLSDTEHITRMGELCDRYGMDTISMSNIIGLAFALFDDGIITEKDTDGLKLKWGDAIIAEKLIHKTVKQEGFGAILARGARNFGRFFGAEDKAVQVNGLELAYHDPRGGSGMAVVYATSPRGGCHNQSDYFMVDIGQVEDSLGLKYFSRHGGTEKSKNIAIHQDWRTVFNSLVMCLFANVEPKKVVELIRAASGVDWCIEDMMRSGERGWNLKRAINNRLGITRRNDRVPEAFLHPYQDDPSGKSSHVPDINTMLVEYYEERGWDYETGKPKREKLEELDLDWVADDLWS